MLKPTSWARGATPETPVPLPSRAAIRPATEVPCVSSLLQGMGKPCRPATLPPLVADRPNMPASVR